MPRQARLDSPGTLHHVMIRGIEGRNIFLGDEDREKFLSRVRELSLDTGTRILAWALMKNHVLCSSVAFQRWGRASCLYEKIVNRLCSVV